MLQEGVHDTTIDEIRRTLGFSDRRKTLIQGLEEYLRIWERLGLVDHAIVDGSFVTDKAEPCDIDILLVPKPGEELFEEFAKAAAWLCVDREGTKEDFGCEAFPVSGLDSDDLREWIGFFSHDREGNVRGLLRLRLPL